MSYARLLALAAAVFTTPARVCPAQTYDYYISGNAGVTVLEDADTELTAFPGTVDYEFDRGLALSAAVGAADGNYRSELEIYHQKSDLDGVRATGTGFDPTGAGTVGDLKILIGLVNAYYEFQTGGLVRPYLTGGLGYAKLDAEFSAEGFDEVTLVDEESGLAWQLGAGLDFAVTGSISLDLRYRYLSGDDVEFDAGETDISGHSLTAGVRFTFP